MCIYGTEFEIMELLSSLPNIGIPHPSKEYIEELQSRDDTVMYHGYDVKIIFVDEET